MSTLRWTSSVPTSWIRKWVRRAADPLSSDRHFTMTVRLASDGPRRCAISMSLATKICLHLFCRRLAASWIASSVRPCHGAGMVICFRPHAPLRPRCTRGGCAVLIDLGKGRQSRIALLSPRRHPRVTACLGAGRPHDDRTMVRLERAIGVRAGNRGQDLGQTSGRHCRQIAGQSSDLDSGHSLRTAFGPPFKPKLRPERRLRIAGSNSVSECCA